MSMPNPLQPQGTLTSASQGKSNLRFTILAILAFHAVVLGGLLLQGCDKNAGSSGAAPPPGPSLTDLPPLTPTPMYYETNDPLQYVTAPPPEPVPTNVGLTPIPPAQAATPVVESLPRLPATPDPALAPVASSPTEHKIARGDTLGALAAKHGTTVRAIEALNPGINPNRLQVGQTVLIPPPRPKPAATASAAGTPDSGEVYTVKAGDTLLRISRQFGTTPREIRALNGLKSDRILVGQKLKIPARAPAATAAAPSAAGGGKQF